MQRTNKTLEQGLHCSLKHRAPSRGGLKSPSRRMSSVGFTFQVNSQREVGGERERKQSYSFKPNGGGIDSFYAYPVQ